MKKLKEILNNRIIENWKTSIVGVILIGSVLGLVWGGKAPLVDSTPLIVIGLGLMGLKDPKSIGR